MKLFLKNIWSFICLQDIELSYKDIQSIKKLTEEGLLKQKENDQKTLESYIKKIEEGIESSAMEGKNYYCVNSRVFGGYIREDFKDKLFYYFEEKFYEVENVPIAYTYTYNTQNFTIKW